MVLCLTNGLDDQYTIFRRHSNLRMLVDSYIIAYFQQLIKV
jgi:hypothetical protein